MVNLIRTIQVRIVNYKNNFLLSVGEYKYRDHVKLRKYFGKIILINKDTKITQYWQVV